MDYIRKLNIQENFVKNEDSMKLEFPLIMKHVVDIQLFNENTGIKLHYYDPEFARQIDGSLGEKGRLGDIIYIIFVPDKLPYIRCTVEIREIVKYNCSVYEMSLRKKIYELNQDEICIDGLRLNILKAIKEEERANCKYFIDIDTDILGIDANFVQIKRLEYINMIKDMKNDGKLLY